MDTSVLKYYAVRCKARGFQCVLPSQELLDLIAAYEGAQFAAAQHLQTVELQAKMLAAAPHQRNEQ